MQKDNPFFDDLARMASSAAGSVMDMRREIEQMIAQQCERFFKKSGFVSQEEFDLVRAMAEKARSENEALAARIAALEQQLAPPTPVGKKSKSS